MFLEDSGKDCTWTVSRLGDLDGLQSSNNSSPEGLFIHSVEKPRVTSLLDQEGTSVASWDESVIYDESYHIPNQRAPPRTAF